MKDWLKGVAGAVVGVAGGVGVTLGLQAPESMSSSQYREVMKQAAALITAHPPSAECQDMRVIEANTLPGQLLVQDLASGFDGKQMAPVKRTILVRRDGEVVFGFEFADGCVSMPLVFTWELKQTIGGR